MGKKKSTTSAVKAGGSKQERARAAAAANPVRPEDLKNPAPAPRAGEASSKAAAGSPTPATPSGGFRRPASFSFAGVGRNDICPCGSGKRFKNCHGH